MSVRPIAVLGVVLSLCACKARGAATSIGPEDAPSPSVAVDSAPASDPDPTACTGAVLDLDALVRPGERVDTRPGTHTFGGPCAWKGKRGNLPPAPTEADLGFAIEPPTPSVESGKGVEFRVLLVNKTQRPIVVPLTGCSNDPLVRIEPRNDNGTRADVLPRIGNVGCGISLGCSSYQAVVTIEAGGKAFTRVRFDAVTRRLGADCIESVEGALPAGHYRLAVLVGLAVTQNTWHLLEGGVDVREPSD